MYPLVCRFLGFPRLQGGAETCLDWGSHLAGRIRTKDVPLLIRALGVRRLGVADQARRTLAKLAGRDLGPEPGPWLEWWAAQPRARGRPEVRAPRPKPVFEARPVPASLGLGWQIVLTVVFAAAGLLFLFTTLVLPKGLALPAWALALGVILWVPRILESVRRRRRQSTNERGYCHRERRQP